MAPKVENELRKMNKYFGADYAEKLSKEDEVFTKQMFSLTKTDVVRDVSTPIYFKMETCSMRKFIPSNTCHQQEPELVDEIILTYSRKKIFKFAFLLDVRN